MGATMAQVSDAFYLDMQRTANELIAEFVQGTVTLTRTVHGLPDPAAPWLPGLPTSTVYTLSTVVEGVKASHVNGTTILAGDLKVQAAVLATDGAGNIGNLEPRMEDVLRIGDRPHQIKKIEPMPASGIPVYYDIYVAA